MRVIIGLQPIEEMKYLFKFIFQFFALAKHGVDYHLTQKAKFGGVDVKWRTENLNTGFSDYAVVCGI